MSGPRVQIETREDDSVTVTVGEVVAHVKAPTWREAIDAAHALSGILSRRVEVRDVRSRLAGMRHELEELSRLLGAAEGHLLSALDDARVVRGEDT